jgi:hypothetical protein
MLDVKIDLLKNRLYITLGRARNDQVSNSVPMIEEKIRQLESGFTCITRIIDMREINEDDVKAITQVQSLLCKYGMSKAVRVGIDKGKEILDQVGQDVNYSTTSANSPQEAEKILDEWVANECLK